MCVTTTSTKYQVVIPHKVCKQFNIAPVNKVVFIPHKKILRRVIVPPIEQVECFPPDINPDPQRKEQDKERWMWLMIYATTHTYNATLRTQNAYFSELESMKYILKQLQNP